MKFILGANTLTFEEGADYPASRPVEKAQAIDRTDAGTTEVEKLGPDIARRTLEFNEMSETDYLGLKNWWETIADGAINPFEFEDEKGDVGTIIILTPVYDFPEVFHKLYSGSMLVEYT